MRTGGPLDRWRWAREYQPEQGSLPGPFRSVLIELAYHADNAGVCYPSQEALAENTRFSRRTIIRAVEALVKMGALVVVQSGRGGGRGATRYRLIGGVFGWASQGKPNVPESHIGQSDRESQPRADSKVPESHIGQSDGESHSKAEPNVPESHNQSDRESHSKAEPNVPLSPTKVTESPNQSDRESQEPCIEPSEKKGRERRARAGGHPKVSEEFIGEMEKVFVDAEFDVREEINRALSHSSARKYNPPDLYVKKWLSREADPSWGRRGGATRAEPVTDHRKDFFGGNDESP